MVTHNTYAARLVIGVYYINIFQDDSAPVRYILPAAARAFIDNESADSKNREKADFTLILSDDKLPDIKKENVIRICNIGPTPYTISRNEANELLWIRYKNRGQVNLAYIISNDWSCWRLIAVSSKAYGKRGFEELTYIFAYSVIKKGGIMLHGVIMDWAGSGILVCAHSGVGKTTHTAMWESKENARIINGDKALCYQDNNIWYSCGSPWCGTSGKYINSSIAIKAIVLLERGDTNRVCHVSPLQGAMSLIALTYAPTWDEELMSSALNILNNLVMRVPVYKLYCRPDYEAVKILKQELQKISG